MKKTGLFGRFSRQCGSGEPSLTLMPFGKALGHSVFVTQKPHPVDAVFAVKTGGSGGIEPTCI